MIWLRSLTNCPAGEFSYVQGGQHFERTPLIRELATRVLDFRKGNGLPRAGYGEVLEDIVLYTCARLNNDPQWCMETDLNAAALLPAASGGSCGGCGASVT